MVDYNYQEDEEFLAGIQEEDEEEYQEDGTDKAYPEDEHKEHSQEEGYQEDGFSEEEAMPEE